MQPLATAWMLAVGFLSASDPNAVLDVEGDLGAPTGHEVVIPESGFYAFDARSLDADVALIVVTPDGAELRDEDSGIGTNARLVVQAAAGETYSIRVDSPRDAGRYGLRVTQGRPPAPDSEALHRQEIRFHRDSADRAESDDRAEDAIDHRIRQAELLIQALDAAAAVEVLRATEPRQETPLHSRVAATLARAELRTGAPDALARLIAAVDDLRKHGLHRAELLARWDITTRMFQQADRDATYAELDRVEELARLLDDQTVRAQALHRRGQNAAMHGDLAVALESWDEATSLFERVGDLVDAADMAINSAATRMHVDDWDGAETSIETARRLLEGSDDPERQSYTWLMLAAVHRHRWDMDKNHEALKAALEVARDDGSRPTEYLQAALIEMAEFLMTIGAGEDALDHAEEAVAVAKARGSAGGEARVLVLIGRIQRFLLLYDEAEASYLRAHSLAERSGSIFDEIDAETRIAELTVDQGRHEEALERADRILARLGGHHSQNFAIAAQMIAGDALWRLGRYRRAEQRYRRGLEMARLQGNGPQQADLLPRLGGLQLALGETDAALTTLREARVFAASRGDREAEANAFLGIIEAQLELGRLREALATLDEAPDWTGLPTESVRALVLESRLSAELGETDHAITAARDARARCEEEPVRFRDVHRMALIAEADAHLGAGNESLARELSERARIESIEAGDLEDELDATAILVTSALELGDSGTARRGLERADRILRVLTGVELDIDQAAVYRARRSTFAALRQDLGAREVASAETPEERRVAAERAFLAEGHWKARALLARRDTVAVDAETADRRRRSTELLRRRDRVVRDISTALRSGAPAADVAALREEAERLWERAGRLVDDPSGVAATREATMHAPRGVTADTARSTLLVPGRALVEYVEGRHELRALVVTEDDTRLVALGNRIALRSEIDSYLDLISDPSRLGGVDEISALGRRLYTRLLAPVLGVCGEVTELVVIPSATLATLPLASLVVEAPDTPRTFSDVTFVARKLLLYYGPSASVLVELTGRPTQPAGRLLLLADPVYHPERTETEPDRTWPRGLPRLMETRVEAHAIGRLLGADTAELADASQRSGGISSDRVDVFTGTEASIDKLDDLGRYRVLHLATHGYEDRESPFASGLALSWHAASDGVLSVDDILWKSFDLDLVVLSACRTATGPRAREGVQSIAWAFLASGAGSVVASLWAVSDASSAELMTAFYDEWLRDGSSPARALASARWLDQARTDRLAARGVGRARTREEQRARDLQHPYFWSPFIYIGPPPH